MKIAYLGQMADVSTENGISKKIRMQAGHWIQAGHEVRYFSLAPTAQVWPGLQPVPAQVRTRGNAVARMLQSRRLAQDIRTWQPDVIYFRYAYHSAGFPTLFREIPTVAEINSDDEREYRVTLSRAKQIYHRLTRTRLLASVSGFVAVTRELAARFRNFGRPIQVIGNSVALVDFTVAPLPNVTKPPRVVFIGSPGTPWHGLDRLAEIARLRPEVQIDVVGYSRSHWAGPSTPPTSIHFHGHLPRETYEPLVEGATAALGTLALFRKQMNEGCSLKVREYLAMGLPVIIGHEDTDIPVTAEYFLGLPNSPDSFEPHRVRFDNFLDLWRHRRVSRAAVAHLDVSVKEAQRLTFLRQIMQRPPT